MSDEIAELEARLKRLKQGNKKEEETIPELEDDIPTYVEESELEGLDMETGERILPEAPKPMPKLPEKKVMKPAVIKKPEPIIEPEEVQEEVKEMEEEDKAEEEKLTAEQERLLAIQRDIDRLQNNGVFRVELLYQLIALNNSLQNISETLKNAKSKN